MAAPTPRSLLSDRSRLPKHLALLLVSDATLDPEEAEAAVVLSVERLASWCRVAGIRELTVYDNQGIISKHSDSIQEHLTVPTAAPSKNDFTVQYPLTPPISRPLTPEHNTLGHQLNVSTMEFTSDSQEKTGLSAKPLHLHVVSYAASKGAIASTASSLARDYSRKRSKKSTPKAAFTLTIEAMDSILEGAEGFSSPDLMILHPLLPSAYNQTPIELHGFPPWQIRLTEIYYDKYQDRHLYWPNSAPTPSPLDEIKFRRALDEFAGAEMRLGK